MSNAHTEYEMTISPLIVDKLGVKLYDRIYAVIAEIISNSYDADATVVTVTAPMGVYLAEKDVDGSFIYKDLRIEITDNGIGMTPEELSQYYLHIGSERRRDKRGDMSPKFHRKVMGRKGVGKLAPFGICDIIEILTAGGEEIEEDGKKGFRAAHIILDKKKIYSHNAGDPNYRPDIGEYDNTIQDRTFTTVILRNFSYKRIESIDSLERQLSQRFGIQSDNWKIQLINSEDNESRDVGQFNCSFIDGTKIQFQGTKPTLAKDSDNGYSVLNSDNTINDSLKAGFEYAGKFYPVTGWVAYAKEPFKDELMSGVRIYCRGKIVAQTTAFNHKSGFQGEFSVRTYLIGELHADWLDEDEDLIQTDRRDILWSHELVSEFQEWGQKVVKEIGKKARDPMRQTKRKQFFQKSDIEKRINTSFPGKNQGELRKTAIAIANHLGGVMRDDELNDTEAINDLSEIVLMFAPVKTLDEKLRKAGDDLSSTPSPLKVIRELLYMAQIAETTTFGHQIIERLKIINTLEKMKDDPNTEESDFQELLTSAPWLIDPQWRPLTSNQQLSTFKKEFEKFYKKETEQEINLTNFSDPTKRPDFIMFDQGSILEIVEIKKPCYTFKNKDMERLNNYFEQFTNFFENPNHTEYKKFVSSFHITLICDDQNLSGVCKTAYDKHLADKKLTVIDWSSFFMRTTCVHKEFLEEYDRLNDIE